MGTKHETLLTTTQTIFTVDDLAVIWEMPDRLKLWETIKYYVRTGRLHPIQRGVYARTESYSPFEASIKIQNPSYITYTTALAYHRLAYQYSNEIHLMAKKSKKIELLAGQTLIYHQLKNKVLLNQIGIIYKDNFWIATPERAVCDTSYLEPGFPFERIEKLDTLRLEQIAQIYENTKLVKRIEQLISEIERENKHAG